MNKYKCPLTALQFLVMRFINKGTAGPILHEKMAKWGHLNSNSAFYQLMGRLTKAGFIDCTSKSDVYNYTLSNRGKEAMAATQKFYAKRTP